MIFRDVEVKKQ